MRKKLSKKLRRKLHLLVKSLDISMRTAYRLLDKTNDTPNNRGSMRRNRFYNILVS